MNILIAFAPFLVFALTARFIGAEEGLVAGAVVSGGMLLRDLARRKGIKILEAGTVILFLGLALFSGLTKASWSIVEVRLFVDTGLLLIVLVSIAVRRPFTIQYARETVPMELWNSARFIHVNYVVTAVWAAAFLVMVGADLAMLYLPAVSVRVGIWVTILAIYGAFKFTSWYPSRDSGAGSA